MELKYGKFSVMPFASKIRAKEFMIKAQKGGYATSINKRNGVYLVVARKIIRRRKK